jgi:heat shock protein HslJ
MLRRGSAGSGAWAVLRAVAVGVLVAMTLAACGSDSDDTEPGEATTTTAAGSGSDLVGTTFDSTSVSGHELVEGTQIRLTFDEERMGANAGCNTMTGPYSFADGTLRWTGAPAATMMGCEAELQAQDEWLAALLTDGVDAEVDGDLLTLTTDAVTIELRAETDASLTGTTWTLESIVDGEAVSSLPAGVDPPTLEIADDGSVTVFAGCNRGGGTVVITDTTMTFEPIALTQMACEGEAGTLEATVLAVLDGSVDVAVDGDTLTITNGDRGLVYRAT